MISRYSKHFMSTIAQLLEKLAGLLELLGSGTLREVPADDQKVRPKRVDIMRDCLDQPLVMSSKVEVRQVNDPGHALNNMHARQLVSVGPSGSPANRRTGLLEC